MKPDKYLSVSQLEMWERDPALWKLHYIDGQPTPVSKEMVLGSAFHAGVEAFWNGNGPHDAMNAYLEANALSIPTEYYAAITKQGADLLRAWLESDLAKLTPWPVEGASAAEWEFCVPVVGCQRPLYGFIDLLSQEDGQIVIRDSKTLKAPWSKNKVAKSTQRVAYWYAVRQSLGLEPLKFVLDFIVKEEPVRIVSHDAVVAEEEIDNLIERLGRLDREYQAYGG